LVAISPGKLWSLRRLADRTGRFTLLALDQRAATADLIAGRRTRLLHDARIAPTLDDDVGRLRRLLIDDLSPHASGVLIDPDAYAHAAPGLDPARGLILPLEHHAYEDGPDGRRTLLYPSWSAAKARRLGADAVKLRLWYRADAGAAVLAHQHALVERVGQECREHDLAFLLEPLLHALGGAGGGDVPGAGVGDDACEDPVRRPELLLATLHEFRKERYAIDLFMLETPLPPAFIPDPDGSDLACVEAQRWFDRVNALMAWPWVMLSVGATAEHFQRLLTFACRSGASGFLAGGALWWQAAQEFPDWQRLHWRVQQESAPHLSRAVAVLAEYGRAWPEAPPYVGNVEITPVGPGFTERYGN
jgi:tagatose 1,6-diphosphate aldolase